ncbi:unnamed protein product [Withania somnifera]
MAGNDSQKQILTLIRDFASEKSQGKRRIINQNKRIQELQSELEIANAEVEEAKNQKEITEQEIKGYKVELARNKSAIQTLEVYHFFTLMEGIVFIQDELIAYGFDLEALKLLQVINRNCFVPSQASRGKAKAEDAEAFERDLQNELAQIQVEQNIHRQASYFVSVTPVEEELSILERKASLIEAITKENMEMQELARYP